MKTTYLVDELGQLAATMAGLSKRQTEIKNKLKAMNDTEFEGGLFRATKVEGDQTTYSSPAMIQRLLDMGCTDFLDEIATVTHKVSIRVVAKIQDRDRKAA